MDSSYLFLFLFSSLCVSCARVCARVNVDPTVRVSYVFLGKGSCVG